MALVGLAGVGFEAPPGRSWVAAGCAEILMDALRHKGSSRSQGACMTVEYSNLNDRSPGWFLRLARRLLPGVGLVENQIKPYAQAWHERNLEALASVGPLWVVLGDSLSQGVGASSIEYSWVLQTWRALAGHGVHYRIVNLSFSGARVSDVLDRQIPALAGLPAAPELVTVLMAATTSSSATCGHACPGTTARCWLRFPKERWSRPCPGRAVSRPRSTGSCAKPRTPERSWRCRCTTRPTAAPRTTSTRATPATRRSPPTSPPRSSRAGDPSGRSCLPGRRQSHDHHRGRRHGIVVADLDLDVALLLRMPARAGRRRRSLALRPTVASGQTIMEAISRAGTNGLTCGFEWS